MDKLNVEIGSTFDYEILGDMFVYHENVCVVYNSVFSNTRIFDEYVSEEDDIIIIIYDEVELESELEEEIDVNGIAYELRFVSSTFSLDEEWKWNGSIYSRHGGNMYKSWWVLNRKRQLFLHMDENVLDKINIVNLDVSVYVGKMDTDMENVRNEFMKYIGGQSNVQCFEHKLPLIVSSDSSEDVTKDLLMGLISVREKYPSSVHI